MAEIPAPVDHRKLRLEIVDHASVNWARFGELAKKQHEITRKTQYQDLMRTDGEWGDNSEIIVASSLYCVPIRIYNIEGGWVTKENPTGTDRVRFGLVF